MQDQHTEVSRRSPNFFSVTEVAARIGADLETVTDWVEIGAIDRAVWRWSVFKKRTAQSLPGLRTGEIRPVAVLCKRYCPRNGIRFATDLGRNPALLQNLRNSNSNEQEVVGFLVPDETGKRNRPFSRRGSNYSARFRYPEPCG